MTATASEFQSAASFDIYEYLNRHFKHSENLNEDDCVNAEMLNLQLLSSKLYKEIDEQIDLVTANIPRLLVDLEQFVTQVMSMNETLLELSTQVSTSIDVDKISSLHGLKRIENVRICIEDSLSIIKDLDRWENLESEICVALQANSFAKAAIRIMEARQSLARMKDSDNMDDKVKLLEKMAINMENSLIPSLSSSFSAFDFEAISTNHEYFCKIGRQETFFQKYYEVREKESQKIWLDICSKQESSHDSNPETIWLFYDECFSMVKRELTWSFHVFKENLDSVVRKLIFRIFTSTSEFTLKKIIQACVKESDIEQIIKVFSYSEMFLLRLEKTMNMKYQNVNTENQTIHNEWYQPILIPFQNCLVDFENILQMHLVKEFKDSLKSQNISAVMRVAKLNETLPEIFYRASKAIGFCIKFTHGYGIDALLSSLKNYLSHVCSYFFEFSKEQCIVLHENSGSSKIEWEHFFTATRLFSILEQFHQKLKQFGLTEIEAFMKENETRINVNRETISRENSSPYLQNETEHCESKGTFVTVKFCSEIYDKNLTQMTLLSSFLNPIYNYLFQAVIQTQKYILWSLLYPIFGELKGIQKQNVWLSNDQNTGSVALKGLDIPTFSLSPSGYIHRIGEHLLSLPQNLDLSVSQKTDSDVGTNSLSTLSYLIKFLEMAATTLNGNNNVSSNEENIDYMNSYDEEKVDPYQSAHSWLLAVCKITGKQYLLRILSMGHGKFTINGLKQLQVDVDYLFTIFSALGVDQNNDQEFQKTMSLLRSRSNEASINK